MVSVNGECRRSAETAAYLDGELDAQADVRFKEHLAQCETCMQELNEQRRLLCALDFALDDRAPGMALPRDFASIVAAKAEGDMSGLRSRTEHASAFRFCLILTAAAFTLLGGARVYASVSAPIKAFAKSTAVIFGFAWNALYDAGVGAAVIVRALSRHLIFESNPITLIALLCFGIAIAILPRLIGKYHRARITE